MITVVDYGIGNVRAFVNAYRQLNIDVATACDAEELSRANRIILPGVGTFDQAMQRLQLSGMRETLEALVLGRQVPVLGVCVGMQMLARSSEEGILPGLGWVAGRVREFRSQAASATLPQPHMGWNDVVPRVGSRLFRGLETGAAFYFLHSFYLECEEDAETEAVAEYGIAFTCAVRRQNVYGVQFHPEKSHHWGSRLLQNFAEV